MRLCIGCGPGLGHLETGASLAVSGVCLTLTQVAPDHVEVELSPETLRRTTLGQLQQGSLVNLEPALRLGEPLGGHWVQGHVDTTIAVRARRDLGEHRELVLELPPEFAGLVVEKGSVALDGVSLTVAALAADSFAVAVIPHTLAATTVAHLQPGDRVNLEVDILAKYVQRALTTSALATAGGVR